MMQYAHLASKILSRPLLLDPSYASVLFSAFGQRAGFEELHTASGELLDVDGMKRTAESYQVRKERFKSGQYAPYAVVGDGVAVVSVEGSLVQKTGSLDPNSGMQGYDGVRGKMDAALKDPAVKGILLSIDSPGGEVSGAFDMADYVASAKEKKPVWSYADGMMASAAYLIGSQADAVFASQTATVGSVGVLVAHVDRSQQMEKEGLKVTLIHSGAQKVAGNSYAALADDVRADIQSEIDMLRDKFAGAVERGRQNMSKDDVLATEARTYAAQKAVDVGFVDGVASFDEVVAQFSKSLAASADKNLRGTKMSSTQIASTGLSDADVEKMMTEARAEGMAAGAQSEKQRISSLLSHAESEGRTATAQHLAFNTSMAAADAVALLATMPKAAAPVAAAPAADPVMAAAIAGMTQGAGVKPELSSDSTAELSDSDKAAAATMAAIAGMGIKMKA